MLNKGTVSTNTRCKNKEVFTAVGLSSWSGQIEARGRGIGLETQVSDYERYM
jgi:hypothetical protein